VKEALFYKKLDSNKIQCLLCPYKCIVLKDKAGICGVRKSIEGKLIATSYGKVSAIAVDPIETKSLYHFYPSHQILSFGTIGCNFKCPYCQNWHISQDVNYPTEYLEPSEAVEIAEKKKLGMIAYTYSEPLIWYEWVKETAEIAKKNRIKNVLVTNGYINREPLESLVQFIDAANIDVKAFNQKFYSELCGGKLEYVIKNVEYLYNKIHLELTMLLIPGWNDDEKEIESFVQWVSSLSKNMPVHFSRYFPQYNFTLEATPMETLKNAYEIGRKYLNFVYIGNAKIDEGDNTYCPYCNNLLIERDGYNVKIAGLENNKCKKCQNKIEIITD